ncbi:L,D-transpeptidase [Candidatus Nomurabacteria bacterium]|nr:L,D-transpeptidase [Candidatus Nomurabacteria bacterium]
MNKKHISNAVVLVLFIFCVFLLLKSDKTIPQEIKIPEIVPEVLKPEIKPISYLSVVLDSENPKEQLNSLVEDKNLDAVLSLNRIDKNHIKKDMTLVYPDRYDDLFSLSSFPRSIEELKAVPKMMIISQEIQEFGAYEYGKLVRFGGLSSGKKSTPTKNGLFHANWKGKEVVSTSNDEWILKWNVNIDNFDGIGIHEYELPGYPASHSCVRLSSSDARWFYDWVEQWKLSKEDKIISQGAPVLIFGQYDYEDTAPWKLLVEDPYTMTLSEEDISKELTKYNFDLTLSE